MTKEQEYVDIKERALPFTHHYQGNYIKLSALVPTAKFKCTFVSTNLNYSNNIKCKNHIVTFTKSSKQCKNIQKTNKDIRTLALTHSQQIPNLLSELA